MSGSNPRIPVFATKILGNLISEQTKVKDILFYTQKKDRLTSTKRNS